MVTMMIQVAWVAQSHHTKLENVPLKLASILNGTTVISRSQWREHFKSNKNWINGNLHQNAWNWNFYLVAVILPGFYAALEEFASRHCSSFLIFTKNNSKYLLHLAETEATFLIIKANNSKYLLYWRKLMQLLKAVLRTLLWGLSIGPEKFICGGNCTKWHRAGNVPKWHRTNKSKLQ